MIVSLDKLTFPKTAKVYRLYQQYYLMGKEGIQIDPKFQRDLRHTVTERPLSHTSNYDQLSNVALNITESCESNYTKVSVFIQNPFTNPIVSLFDVNITP